MLRLILTVYAAFLPQVAAQNPAFDSLNIQYDVIFIEYGQYEHIFKIRMPEYLNVEQVRQQINLFMELNPATDVRRIHIYIYDSNLSDEEIKRKGSDHRYEYRRGKEPRWRLEKWRPRPIVKPGRREVFIYDTYLDNLIYAGSTAAPDADPDKETERVSKEIMRMFNISADSLQAVLLKVRHWRKFSKWQEKLE